MESALCASEKIPQQLPLASLVEWSEENPSLQEKSPRRKRTWLTPEAKRDAKLKYHREYYRAYRAKYPEKHREAVRRCRDNHRKEYAIRRLELYQLRKIELSAASAARQRTRPYRDKANARLRRRRREDPQFALADSLRATMNRAFRRNWIKKPARTEALIGCTIAEAKAHLERQFVNGMSWDNRLSFCVDHVVPVAAFDLLDAEEARWAFNWRNLQPLTPRDNATKQGSILLPLPAWLPPHIATRILRRATK